MDNKLHRILYKLSIALTFLFAIVISIKELHEPDTFWQLATGNWILDHGQVPKTDVFSYTFNGAQWINIKWGYEVAIALITRIFSADMIPVLQAVLLITLVVVLLKLNRFFMRDGEDPLWHKLVSVFCILLVLALSSYRFNSRPEVISHLLTITFIYQINALRNRKMLLLVLPALQLIWANSHEAFGMGIAICFIYAISDWFWWMYQDRKKEDMPLLITGALLLCIAVIPVNPYGFEMLLRPFSIFGQVSDNKFTYELSDYTTSFYWQPQTYITLVLLIITVLGALISIRKTTIPHRLRFLAGQIRPGNILVVLAMVYLAKDALRNMVFLNLVLTPFLVIAVINIIQLIAGKKNVSFLNLLWGAGACLAGAILYISVVSNSFYKISGINDQYGLRVSTSKNPVDAAAYLEKHHLQHKVLYTDYLSSSYMIYQLQPAYRSFIDLRDLDVFPDSFMRKNAEICAFYESYKEAEETYGFEGAVVLNNQFNSLLKGLYKDSSYYLGYADPLISVFVKDTFKNIIPRYTALSVYSAAQQSALAGIINKVFNPFYKPGNPVVDRQTAEEKYFAGIGDYEKSMSLISKRYNGRPDYNDDELLIAGIYYYRASLNDTIRYASLLDSAEYLLKKSITRSDFSDAHFTLGVIAYNSKQLVNAAKHFEEACRTDQSSVHAHLFAAECYKVLFEATKTNKEYLDKLIRYTERANILEPGNPDVIWNLGMAYYYKKDCGKATELLEQALSFSDYLPEGDIELARQAVNQCRRK